MFERIMKLIDEQKYSKIKELLINMNEFDIAEILDDLPPKQIVKIFRLLPKDIGADVFSYLESDTAALIISSLSDSEAVDIINDMYADDAADLFEEMPANVVAHKDWQNYWSVLVRGTNINLYNTKINAPEFTVIDMNGNTITSDELYERNKVTVLFHWGDLACTPSLAYNKTLKGLYERYGSMDFEILGVYSPGSETEQRLQNYIKANIPWNNIIENHDIGNRIPNLWGVPRLIAVDNNKQVAYLAPTTVLAQQQYDSFKDRMKEYPIRIELLNRFRTKKEQEDTLKRLELGETDILVGTHRVLSKDVNFKNLFINTPFLIKY